MDSHEYLGVQQRFLKYGLENEKKSKPAIKVLCAVLRHSVTSDSVTPWTIVHQVPLPVRILQAKMLKWVTMPSSRESSQSRDQAQVSLHCRWILYQLSHQGSLRILEWVAYPFSSGSSQPRNRTRSPALQVDSLPSEPPGKPKNTGMGSLSLPQQIFQTQESNSGSPALQADSLPAELPGKPHLHIYLMTCICIRQH